MLESAGRPSSVDSPSRCGGGLHVPTDRRSTAAHHDLRAGSRHERRARSRGPRRAHPPPRARRAGFRHAAAHRRGAGARRPATARPTIPTRAASTPLREALVEKLRARERHPGRARRRRHHRGRHPRLCSSPSSALLGPATSCSCCRRTGWRFPSWSASSTARAHRTLPAYLELLNGRVDARTSSPHRVRAALRPADARHLPQHAQQPDRRGAVARAARSAGRRSRSSATCGW